MTPIRNPVLKYYGSKFRLAKWIISHFPPHEHYVEPFGGGASVLLVKPPSKLETYNDADADVVNFFRTLRKMPYRLSRQIEMTPWARDEFAACVRPRGRRNHLERARQIYFKLWMSRASGTRADPSNWRRNRSKRPPIRDIRFGSLIHVARRLREVQIENRNALQLIAEMDSRETLFYIDPPYLASTRTDKNRYAVELNQDAQHRELAAVLYRAKGSIVLSGYACDLYVELFENKGWKRFDTQALANGSVRRIESLWLSPATVKRLANG